MVSTSNMGKLLLTFLPQHCLVGLADTGFVKRLDEDDDVLDLQQQGGRRAGA